jgi:hypothetical protein
MNSKSKKRRGTVVAERCPEGLEREWVLQAWGMLPRRGWWNWMEWAQNIGGRKCFKRVVELFGIMQEDGGRSGVKGRVPSLDIFCDFLSSLGESLIFCTSVLEPNLYIAWGHIQFSSECFSHVAIRFLGGPEGFFEDLNEGQKSICNVSRRRDLGKLVS